MAKPKSETPPTHTPVVNQFSTWDDDPIGFPAYFAPDEDAFDVNIPQRFAGSIVEYQHDHTPRMNNKGEKQFHHRLLFSALEPMTAYRGKANDQDEVHLEPGDLFTVTCYEGLKKYSHPDYIGARVEVTFTGKERISASNTMWRMTAKMHPEDKARIRALHTARLHSEHALPENGAGRALPASPAAHAAS